MFLWIALCYSFFLEVNKIAEVLINDQINEKQVRLIGSNGEQHGIVSMSDALKIAQEEGLDLVLR